MSTTTPKGYHKPTTGDRGSSWFSDLEHNIDRTDTHKHDGTDSEKINVKDLVKSSQTLLSSAWGADLGGSTFKQSVAMPTGLLFDDSQIKVQTSSGDLIFPTITKTGASAFDLSVNDNSLTLLVVYG